MLRPSHSPFSKTASNFAFRPDGIDDGASLDRAESRNAAGRRVARENLLNARRMAVPMEAEAAAAPGYGREVVGRNQWKYYRGDNGTRFRMPRDRYYELRRQMRGYTPAQNSARAALYGGSGRYYRRRRR